MGALAANAHDTSGPLSAGRRLGRYEVLAKLAAGGMAVVYVARAQGVAGFERLVAVKVLHANLAHEEEFISMFLDEARLAARIRHPNVVPTIDISDSLETGYFLVMDYIEGDHLGQLLSGAHKAGERLPLPVIMRVIVDALGGLGAAHDLQDDTGKSLNLVHRDVSPHNIMVGTDGVSRLTDFGVAKAEDRLTHTRDGQVKGKLAYMAPEQASAGKADARSDLFAMGVILWECLTGRRLFRADSTAATLNKLLHDEVPPPSSVHPELAPLDPILGKALAREPDNRFQNAEEFAEALEEVATEVGGIGSLRSVTKAVKRFAEVKLNRDRKLIQDAVNAVNRMGSGQAPFEHDNLSEPSQLSAADISVSQSSLSMSKMSGVFSHATAPGNGHRARRQTMNGVPPPPPPAAGAVSMPEGTGSVILQPQTGGPGQRRFLLLAATLLAAIMVWILTAREDSAGEVRVIQIGPRAGSAPAAPTAAELVAQKARKEAEAKAAAAEAAAQALRDEQARLAAQEAAALEAAKKAEEEALAARKARLSKRNGAKKAGSSNKSKAGAAKAPVAKPAAPPKARKSMDDLILNPYRK